MMGTLNERGDINAAALALYVPILLTATYLIFRYESNTRMAYIYVSVLAASTTRRFFLSTALLIFRYSQNCWSRDDHRCSSGLKHQPLYHSCGPQHSRPLATTHRNAGDDQPRIP